MRVNDQLLEVNGQVLTGMSNAEALATMRSVLQRAGSSQRVALVLARRRKAPLPPGQAAHSSVGQVGHFVCRLLCRSSADRRSNRGHS